MEADVAARRTTGLAGLDAQFGGGIPAGTVHLLVAEPMNAVDLFTYHFAAGGAKHGPCTFASTELPEATIRAGITGVGGDGKKVEVQTLPAGSHSWEPRRPKEGRFVLDNFSKVSLHLGWEEAYGFLEDARAAIKGNEGNLLVTATPGIQEPREMVLLKQWADGVMELGFDRQGFGLYPFLKVTKMRGVPDSARFLLFKETEKGLFMESTRRVF